MKICWLIDDPSWAFCVSLKWIASKSENEHVYLTTKELNDNHGALAEIEADVFVCPYPPWLKCFKSLHNVVSCVKSKRAFE